MNVFAGIDGGQSSTVAVIGDERVVLARASGPPADLVGEPRDSQRQAAALETALAAALCEAGLAPSTRFSALVAGISGFDPGLSPLPDVSARSERTRIVHDADVAHAGALGGEPGIVVIAGTGSVALGNDAGGGGFVRAGGWGYFFGDEGSAVWIARSALRRVMRRSDLGEASLLGSRALAFFGALSLRVVQHAFAHGELSRPALAAFASVVLDSAQVDEDARAVAELAASELADLAVVVDRRLGPAPLRRVSYAGGLFRNDAFAERLERALRDVLPHAALSAPVDDAAAGALTLARRLS